VPTAIGIVIGFAGAGMFSRVLSEWLYGVSAVDTTTYVTAGFIMVAASLLAAGLPAYRASKIDPIEVLRMN
jgi:ABC-type antimicrobial peptide transport system permease subunit